MGIDVVTMASNHTFDFGRQGIVQTMEALRKSDLEYVGMGKDLPDARRPRYVETSGGTMAIVHSTTTAQPGSEAGKPSALIPGRPGVNPLHVEWTYRIPEDRLTQLREISAVAGIEDIKDVWLYREGADRVTDDNFAFMQMIFETVPNEAQSGISLAPYEKDRKAIINQVVEASEMADYIIKSVHSHLGPGGSRNVPESPEFLVDFAHDCIDAGADVFICNGPHQLRGIELYHGKPIFYSLGHFLFHSFPKDYDPAQSFELAGTADDTRPSLLDDTTASLFGHTSGEIDLSRLNQSVMPTCYFDNDELQRVELLPCSKNNARGIPVLARQDQAESILSRIRNRSKRFGTDISIQKGRGIISSV